MITMVGRPPQASALTPVGDVHGLRHTGKRLVVVMPVGESAGPAKRISSQINVVVNWFEELKQRVPTT